MSDDGVFNKCAWRLIPFMGLLYVINSIDRVNVGFAALTMNKDLGFSPAVYGFGAGVFYLGYVLFGVPANVMLERVGARRWIFFIMAAWGALSAACAMVQTPLSFYVIRFLLGAAEAGFFPGMVFILTLWFPERHRARHIAGFQSGIPLSFVVGGPLSGLILGMNGLGGLHGWQWLFLLEGLPACLLAFAVLKFLPDGPASASWLTGEEKAMIAAHIAASDTKANRDLWRALRDPRVIVLGLVLFCSICGGAGIQFWLPQIAQEMGYSNRATGFVVALPAVVAIGAMILWGRSSDRRGERIWHVTLAILLTAAGFIVASFAQSDLVVLVALMVAFVAQLATLPVLNSLPVSFLRGPAAAGGIALYNSIGLSGGFLGPYMIGALKEETGAYAASMAALAGLLVLAATIVLVLGRTMARRPSMAPAKIGGGA